MSYDHNKLWHPLAAKSHLYDNIWYVPVYKLTLCRYTVMCTAVYLIPAAMYPAAGYGLQIPWTWFRVTRPTSPVTDAVYVIPAAIYPVAGYEDTPFSQTKVWQPLNANSIFVK